jgi:4-hydroxybenzoate polyprenyltransferase
LNRQIISTLFYGNIFYACCTVALCIETNLLAGQPLNSLPFYLVIGFATILFYSIIYYVSSKKINKEIVAFDWKNRTVWYSYHRNYIRILLIISGIIIIASGIYFSVENFSRLFSLPVWKYFLLALFPLVSITYSFNVLPFKNLSILRQIGVLKPFILGFAWSGFVTLFPLFLLEIEGRSQNTNALPAYWLFIQNFVFISMLCIIFDIKDVQLDQKQKLRTIPVILGVQRTIYFVIIPLLIMNLLLKTIYMMANEMLVMQIIIRDLPNIVLIWLSLQVRQRKSTLYYLAVIDGMMLVKAITGIISTYL